MTYVTDPIGDLLTRMRNAQGVGHDQCRVPWSRIKQQLCEVLQKEKWISGVAVEGEGIEKEIVIAFHPEKPALILKRVSKPGRRSYAGAKKLKPVLRGFGLAILTTSEGLMTDADARKKGIGGEVLCIVS